MPAALTYQEKVERINAKLLEKQEGSSPAVDGATRKRRNVFNGTEAKLGVRSQIPGYHLHIFTDVGSRVQEAIDSGYEFVTPTEIGGVSENVVSRNGDLGERIRYLVNPRAEGTEQFGYLMKVRQEWFEEDQAELQAKNNRIDSAIRKGKMGGDSPQFYVPNGGIKLT
jgi:hypothetical protein|tara:strand:+ start:258 stop:761 length:504 start_codon:yes stop_codon:yes gene_type:complete